MFQIGNSSSEKTPPAPGLDMKALAKFAVVLAGYAAAVLAANAAVAVRIAHTNGPDAQASAGMYAFGDGLVFIAVFGAVALVPTGLALWFLRPYRWFWAVLSVTALTIAATAVPAGALCVLERFLAIPRESVLEYLAALSFLRTIVSPPLAAAFVVAGLVAPSRASRWSLLAAAGIEGVVAVYSVLQWFVGCCYI
jgi:hypothetical protein